MIQKPYAKLGCSSHDNDPAVAFALNFFKQIVDGAYDYVERKDHPSTEYERTHRFASDDTYEKTRWKEIIPKIRELQDLTIRNSEALAGGRGGLEKTVIAMRKARGDVAVLKGAEYDDYSAEFSVVSRMVDFQNHHQKADIFQKYYKQLGVPQLLVFEDKELERSFAKSEESARQSAKKELKKELDAVTKLGAAPLDPPVLRIENPKRYTHFFPKAQLACETSGAPKVVELGHHLQGIKKGLDKAIELERLRSQCLEEIKKDSRYSACRTPEEKRDYLAQEAIKTYSFSRNLSEEEPTFKACKKAGVFKKPPIAGQCAVDFHPNGYMVIHDYGDQAYIKQYLDTLRAQNAAKKSPSGQEVIASPKPFRTETIPPHGLQSLDWNDAAASGFGDGHLSDLLKMLPILPKAKAPPGIKR